MVRGYPPRLWRNPKGRPRGPNNAFLKSDVKKDEGQCSGDNSRRLETVVFQAFTVSRVTVPESFEPQTPRRASRLSMQVLIAATGNVIARDAVGLNRRSSPNKGTLAAS